MSLRAQIISQTRRPRFGRVGDYTALPELGKDSLARDGTIVVRKERARDDDESELFLIQLDGRAFGLRQEDNSMLAGLDIKPTELHQLVEVCRAVWREVITTSVERRRFGIWKTNERPLLKRIRQDEAFLRRIGARLARAGADLFGGVFAMGCPRLPELRKRLQEGLTAAECVITVYADEFFLPWGMLYFHPPEAGKLDPLGSNWRPEGFLGYRHVIEQATDDFVPVPAIIASDTGLSFGFTFDPRIEIQEGIAYIRSQRRFFQSQGTLRSNERSTKRQIEDAFRAENFPDQVSYFFLHSTTAGKDGHILPARFFLGRESVEAAEIKAWCEARALASQPLFFFNACQAGQMRTPFYESFALLLLELRARGLIGPQVDIPTLFAEKYAQRFFAAFLAKGGTPGMRVGEIVKDLTRSFLKSDSGNRNTDLNNPLGLVYSLYKGLDCYLIWQNAVR